MRIQRKRFLKIRFSDAEWDQIHAAFPKRKVGTGIRKLALGQAPPRNSPALEVRREKLNALARIGNNLNQVARAVNTANLTGSKVDTARLLAKLVELQDRLDAL